VGILSEHQEVKCVRVFRDLLREIRLRRRDRSLEIRNRRSGALMQCRLNLMDKDIATPAVLDTRPCVPDPVRFGCELF
jgi:hypothetical protein